MSFTENFYFFSCPNFSLFELVFKVKTMKGRPVTFMSGVLTKE